MLDWEWFKDINTCYLFFYFLLRANWTDGNFRGMKVKRGSFITSLQHISNDTGLSIQQIRTSISKLKSTCEITSKATSKFTIISIVKYNDYQETLEKNNKQNNKHSNIKITNNQQQYNKKNNIINSLSIDNIEKLVREKNYNINVNEFYECYKNQEIKNINALLKKWNDTNKLKKTFNNYSERSETTQEEITNMNKLYKKYGGSLC